MACCKKLRERAVVPTVQKSEIRFIPTERLAELDFTPEAPPEIRWLAAEQSNSSLVIGDRVVLKLVRRLVGGIHPEAEMSRYLTKLGYANTGPLFGEVVRVDPQNVPHTLAILQGYIDNQGDAWNYALDYLRRTVDELAVAVDSEEHADGSPQRVAGLRRLPGDRGHHRPAARGIARRARLADRRRSVLPATRDEERRARLDQTARLRCSPPRSTSSRRRSAISTSTTVSSRKA